MITDEQAEKALETFKDKMWRDGEIPAMRAALSADLTPSAGEAEPVAWLAEGAGWGRVFISKEAAEKLAAQDGTLKPLYTHPSPSASEAQVRVKVRPLDWVTLTCDQLMARTDLVIYIVDGDPGCGSPAWYPCDKDEDWHPEETMEAAKAAAQADYERRILSALSTPEQGEAEAPDQLTVSMTADQLCRSPHIEEITPLGNEWAACETMQNRYDLMKRRVRSAFTLSSTAADEGRAMSDIVRLLRETMAKMALYCSVPMGLWQEHSTAVLQGADRIEQLERENSELRALPDDGGPLTVSYPVHEIAHNLLIAHTGSEGGCPRIDWYKLRAEISDAIAVALDRQRQIDTAAELRSELASARSQARREVLEDAIAMIKARMNSDSQAHDFATIAAIRRLTEQEE